MKIDLVLCLLLLLLCGVMLMLTFVCVLGFALPGTMMLAEYLLN